MNPDPYAQSLYAAGYAAARRDLDAKRAQSRAAQPKRKHNRKHTPRGNR